MEARLESTKGLARQAEVWVGGTLFVVMDEYGRPGEDLEPGVLEHVKFVYLTDEGFTWADAMGGNRAERRLVEHVQGWRYVGYGRVIQIMPVVIDFGLLQMEDANWTNDEGLVGRYVRIPIDRLSIVRDHEWEEIEAPSWRRA